MNEHVVKEKAQVLLEPRSLLVLQDEVRYKWEHGVQPTAEHTFAGRPIAKSRRLSLVFWRTLTPGYLGSTYEQSPAVRERITLVEDFTFPKQKFFI